MSVCRHKKDTSCGQWIEHTGGKHGKKFSWAGNLLQRENTTDLLEIIEISMRSCKSPPY